MIRYACRRDMLPTIEAALIAHGYQIAMPLHKRSSGAGTMVLARGLTSVLLAQELDTALLEIAIWGVVQPAIANVIESLPIALHKQPSPAIVARERT